MKLLGLIFYLFELIKQTFIFIQNSAGFKLILKYLELAIQVSDHKRYTELYTKVAPTLLVWVIMYLSLCKYFKAQGFDKFHTVSASTAALVTYLYYSIIWQIIIIIALAQLTLKLK